MLFPLKRDGHTQHVFGKHAAFESSKEMSRIYKILWEPGRPIIRQCDMLDFQAMTTVLILIPLLLESSITLDTEQVEQGWQAVHDTLN